MWKGRKIIANAPYWYNTPYEKLDFEWSREEELEIERYCEKILQNIKEEGGMTPLERFNATMWGKDKDRMLISQLFGNAYNSKTLDSAAGAIRPLEVNQYPKLWVKSCLATVARFKLDYAGTQNINYGEDMWGGQSRMIELGNPILVPPPPIKTIEDMEGMTVPDPLKDGLYPGYIWANREYRRIIDKYKVPIAFQASYCVGPDCQVMMGMTGFGEFPLVLRKHPEVVRKGMDIATEFLIKFGSAMIDECKPDGMYM